MFKDSGDTTADFLERMRADREMEDAIDRRYLSSSHGTWPNTVWLAETEVSEQLD
jgi:hypothetical protein